MGPETQKKRGKEKLKSIKEFFTDDVKSILIENYYTGKKYELKRGRRDKIPEHFYDQEYVHGIPYQPERKRIVDEKEKHFLLRKAIKFKPKRDCGKKPYHQKEDREKANRFRSGIINALAGVAPYKRILVREENGTSIHHDGCIQKKVKTILLPFHEYSSCDVDILNVHLHRKGFNVLWIFDFTQGKEVFDGKDSFLWDSRINPKVIHYLTSKGKSGKESQYFLQRNDGGIYRFESLRELSLPDVRIQVKEKYTMEEFIQALKHYDPRLYPEEFRQSLKYFPYSILDLYRKEYKTMDVKNLLTGDVYRIIRNPFTEGDRHPRGLHYQKDDRRFSENPVYIRDSSKRIWKLVGFEYKSSYMPPMI